MRFRSADSFRKRSPTLCAMTGVDPPKLLLRSLPFPAQPRPFLSSRQGNFRSRQV